MPSEIENLKPRSAGYVLVVDDEEQNRTLLRDPLEARGYEIAEAENGMQALEKIAARLPDVILLDVMMSQMDGFEVCSHPDGHRAVGPQGTADGHFCRRERFFEQAG
jgi:CheY-like chemotaxis protein